MVMSFYTWNEGILTCNLSEHPIETWMISDALGRKDTNHAKLFILFKNLVEISVLMVSIINSKEVIEFLETNYKHNEGTSDTV